MTLLEKCKDLENLMSKKSHLGSDDSEPHHQLRHSLRSKIEKNVDYIPENADDWELYSSEKGAEELAKEMTEKLKNIISSLRSHSLDEVEEVKRWYGI